LPPLLSGSRSLQGVADLGVLVARLGGLHSRVRREPARCRLGGEGRAEMQSQVNETMHAAGEAIATLVLGGAPEVVIGGYSQQVAFIPRRVAHA
ncbi:hypothetical protein MKK82_11575, partial [Methylobacterium sp. E-046]|nr:hypothetical protein [Methylobacterium sp. E-046]